MVDRSVTRRVARVSDNIRDILGHLIVTAVGDPALSWVTITGAESSPDLRQARVFYVVSGGNDQKRVQKSLERAAPYFQRELGASLKMRFIPRLVFSYDQSLDAGQRIEQLIEETKEERQKQLSEDAPQAVFGRLVDRAESILVAAHRNPDGDAIGSLLGMSGILRLLGKKPVVYCPDGVPEILGFLPGASDVTVELAPDAAFELTILLDTADESLLPQGLPGPERRGTLVIIDHHQHYSEFGDLVIRPEAAAVGEILFRLARDLVWPIDRDIAECLYTSIVADTGSFRYSSTGPETHRVAAELILAGAEPWTVALALFESFPYARQRLLGEVAGTLTISADGKLATMLADPEMLARCGAKKADLDGMVNLGRSVAGVEISALFRRQTDGTTKVSFRSKGQTDVGEFAARFGGGGHRNAAGCTLESADLEANLELIRKTVTEFLGKG